MAQTTQGVLRSEIITGVVSRIAASSSWLLNYFGFQPGGPGVNAVGHRHGSYDIYNNTRKIARGAAPGAPAPRTTRQPVGNVPYVIARAHDSLWIPAEEVHNLRRIGGPSSQFDEAGQVYLSRQAQTLGQKIANFRTLMLMGMLRGQIHAHPDSGGDALYYDFTSSNAMWSIDMKVPAGNRGQLDMLGGGNIIGATWANAATDIHSQLLGINRAFERLCGAKLEVVLLQSTVWNHVLNNTKIQALAGSSNTPFTQYTRVVGTRPDGTPLNMFVCRLTGIPWIQWVIMDEIMEVGPLGSEVATPIIPDNSAVFLGGEPSQAMYQGLEGSEPVCDFDGAPEVVRTGVYGWTVKTSNPTGTSMFVLDNFTPSIIVPNAHAIGTVVFG